MNNISQSKLQRLRVSIGWRRKTAIVLPRETLTHILHYFPRKQLVKRYSRVHSTFFQTVNRLLPNLHVIHEDNIKFLWPNLYENDCEWTPIFIEFKGAILCKSRMKYGKIGRLLNRTTEKRMTVEDFLTDNPPWFIQFPSFEVCAFTDYETKILPFLRATQQNFVNSRVKFRMCHGWEYEKLPELLADTFLDAGEIVVVITNNRSVGQSPNKKFVSFKVLSETNAVRNCDKVRMEFPCGNECRSGNRCSCSRQTTESAIKWLEWKQHERGSRRHLTLCSYDRCEELFEMLIQEFKVATKPVNYVLTYTDARLPARRDRFVRYRGLDLENELTGERLTFIWKKVFLFRLWRRIATPSDSGWMSALAENNSANTLEGFDSKFYKCENMYIGHIEFDSWEYDASGSLVIVEKNC